MRAKGGRIKESSSQTPDSLQLQIAAKRHQVLAMAALATHPWKTVFETAALEVSLELLCHIPRQRRALDRQLRLERRVVILNELIKEGAFRAVAHVRRRAHSPNWLPCQLASAT
jgi:hypothetical protein